MSSVIGIDLGTTNCAIARFTELGVADVLSGSDGGRTFPSAVYLDQDGDYSIGREAKAAALFAPDRVAMFFKRSMGSALPCLVANQLELSPEALSAVLLRGLVAEVADSLDGPPFLSVVSVPAYFHNVHREATSRACRAAGLDVLGMINEPTAAALAYAQFKPSIAGLMLVYDLGGGTFDVSLVDYSPDAIRVVASTGNHSLGGKDWDDALMALVAGQIRSSHGVDILSDDLALADVRARCELLKMTLSARDSGRIAIDACGVRDTLVVTRSDFEDNTAHLLSQTGSLLEALLEEASIDRSDVSETLLVGGSTRMPAVRSLVSEFFGTPPLTDINPDEAVAIGAAVRAGQLAEIESHVASGRVGTIRATRDVAPHSLGYVQVSGDGSRYINGIVVRKNTPLPAFEVRPGDVRTSANAENSFEVIVMQGDDPRVLDDEFVAAYTVSGVPHYEGETTVDVAFGYDASGVVQVDAVDRRSGMPLTVVASGADDLSWTDANPAEESREAAVDVVFVIDTSGSMGDEIDAIKRSCLGFAEFIEREGAAVRLGVVGFGIGNATIGPPVWSVCRGRKYTYGTMALTSPREFKEAMGQFQLCCFGGGGCYVAEQATLEVMDAAFNMFDSGDYSDRKLVLISDEIGSNDALSEMVAHASARAITVHVMGVAGADRSHERLASETGGQFWPITGAKNHSFSSLLEEVAGEIARSIAREHTDGVCGRGAAGFQLRR